MLVFSLLFLFPSFSEAVHASETANACFNKVNFPQTPLHQDTTLGWEVATPLKRRIFQFASVTDISMNFMNQLRVSYGPNYQIFPGRNIRRIGGAIPVSSSFREAPLQLVPDVYRAAIGHSCCQSWKVCSAGLGEVWWGLKTWTWFGGFTLQGTPKSLNVSDRERMRETMDDMCCQLTAWDWENVKEQVVEDSVVRYVLDEERHGFKPF